jgi:hypothetical protein
VSPLHISNLLPHDTPTIALMQILVPTTSARA